MGEIINTRDLITNVVDMHDSILQSQYSRFLDKSPTMTTYFHINVVQSTVDLGSMNIERPLGDNSPLRYTKVNNFPLYGLEEAAFSLDEDEEGLDMNFHSSAILIPNTLDPYPGDCFTTQTLGEGFVFLVTNVELDTVRSNPFTRIEYKLMAVDKGSNTFNQLSRQSVEEFETVISNVGTEELVFIDSKDVEIMLQLHKIKKEVSAYYKMLFYEQRYNSFLFYPMDGTKVYDRALSMFIQKNKVFYEKNSYSTLMLTVEDRDRYQDLEYHNSLFKAIEMRDVSLLKHNKHFLNFIGDGASIFVRWSDEYVRSVKQGTTSGKPYVDVDIIEFFKKAPDLFKKEPLPEGNGTGTNIILPTNEVPEYYPEADITRDITEDTTLQEVMNMPRKDFPVKEEDTGVINLNSLFFEPEPVKPVIKPVPLPPKPPVTIATKEETIGVVKPVNMVERITEAVNTKLEPIEREYLKKKEIDKFNVMIRTIGQYMSGQTLNYSDLDIKGLANHLNYMDMYDHNTFVLVPVLLHVLNSIGKSQ